jgi:hypothetical protein
MREIWSTLLRHSRKTERGAPFALLPDSRKTERGASPFLVRLAVRAAPFALLPDSRKTERGASPFLVRLAERGAPFALLPDSRKTERGASPFLVRLAERGASPFLVRLAERAAPFALLLLCMLPAAAQQIVTTGSLEGRVTDESAAVVPGAAIAVHSLDAGVTVNSRTSSGGLFSFPSVVPGRYRLTVSADGFRTVSITPLAVLVGRSTSQNVQLAAGAPSDTVTVSGTTPLIRTTESSLSTVIERDLLDDLPLSGRRFTDFALLTPNASADGQSGLVSMGGQEGGEDSGYANGNGSNSFTVDGASATSNYYGDTRGRTRVPFIFGEDAIQEFQVATSPYSAIYGGGGSGFINTVTRSGTDAFHGKAFYFNRNSATGANDSIDKASGVPRPLNVLQQFGASTGGPIRPGKLWFFFDYEQQRQKNPISVINAGQAAVDETAFGVPAGTPLPPSNSLFPAPSSLSAPDPANPVYLLDVANALGAIQANLGSRQRRADDLAFLEKTDWRPSPNHSIALSLNLNRFDSPGGEITTNPVAIFGRQALSNNSVRDYAASVSWTQTLTPTLLGEFHAAFTRDDQIATPSGLVDPNYPTVYLLSPEPFILANAGFASGVTHEAQWELAQHFTFVRGKHELRFGADMNYTHVIDALSSSFDPDADRLSGTFRGTYYFTDLPSFALGIYNTFAQNAGNPNYGFNVPFFGFYIQDKYRILPRLTLEFGLREDFQVYPQPSENPAFPLTGQYPNQYNRLAPRFGFAWMAGEKTVLRGGFGLFRENFNGLNYRNSVISNGLVSQQSSTSTTFNPAFAPNQQTPSADSPDGPFGPTFPNGITDQAFFSASSNLSFVDPRFRTPYVLQSSLQIEREITTDTVLSLSVLWTHGTHLISSSAYDYNLFPPSGTTTYVTCPANAVSAPCSGPQIVLPNLDSGLLREGRVNPNLGQINALISPGNNNYYSGSLQLQRRLSHGLAVQASYTLSHNIQSNGVDFSNQFDFSNTRGPYLLDQRHRFTAAAVYATGAPKGVSSPAVRGLLSNWTLSTVMQFSSGRPYAALLDSACTSSTLSFDNCDGESNGVNDSAFNQSTANTALGINGSGPSPAVGLNSFNGPWIMQVDAAVSRSFALTERQKIILTAQAFNLANHANFYVQNGNGVNSIQYNPIGQNCGDGQTQNQVCYLVPDSGAGGFKSLQSINALNGPRIFQFALRYSF